MNNRRIFGELLGAVLLFQLACARPHPTPVPSADEVRDFDGGPAPTAPAKFWLTILHSSDMESHIVNPGGQQTAFGGADRFRSVVERLEAMTAPAGSRAHRATLIISAGDNFLCGAELDISRKHGEPFYDTLGEHDIGYDAMGFGNHEFDLGPEVLAQFLQGFGTLPKPPVFLCANLDFSGEPQLEAFVREGRIRKSVVLVRGGERIGLIGIDTPDLPRISSGRNVRVEPDLVAVVQQQIDLLRRERVNKIVLVSHLQDINNERALAPKLRGVDIIVAGGGHEVLGKRDTELLPGDAAVGGYPITARDRDGNPVLIVTANCCYRYVGCLVAGFDADGRIVAWRKDSGPARVVSTDFPDGVAPDPQVHAEVVVPVQRGLDEMKSRMLARSEVALEGHWSGLRTQETNEGDLVADSILDAATRLAPRFKCPAPDLALITGGALRSNSTLPPGALSELDVYAILPYPNFVTIVPAVPPALLKELLENAVSKVESQSPRFPQLAGLEMVWDPGGVAQVQDAHGNITTPGSRVRELRLRGGVAIVTGGVVQPGAPSVNIATIDFLARGGDEYPFGGRPFTLLGESYQQALIDYVTTTLNGSITASTYPESGTNRIRRAQ